MESTNRSVLGAPLMESPPHPPRPLCRNDFEIAIICALPLEYDAVSNLFDGYWNDDGDPYGKIDGDQNTYTTGWIGNHNVVLTLLSDMGKASATSVATSFSLSYTRVQLALLVGICGGVPTTADGAEIFLGDVIVSQRLVQYDLGRWYPDRFRPKCTLAGDYILNSNIYRFLTTVQTDRYRTLLNKKALEHLRATQDRYPEKYNYLGASEDKLFRSTYRHKHQLSAGCGICNQCTERSHPTCNIALNSTCEDLKCDEHQIVSRRRLDRKSAWTHTSQATAPHLIVHFGTMASGDSVMKSAYDRDKIADSLNVIAFEMEGAGVFQSLPCLIIKGVCDYADSHKNKKWQNYAAVIAACVMKALLKWYPSADRRPRQLPSEASQEMARLQQKNQNLQKMVKELEAQVLTQNFQLPPQVPCRDLVAVNDALGETYGFSLNFVDSLELFLTILRRKFEHVGLGKIERGEWMLQNHHTGQVLDLKRPWKVIVKPGQTLDMSMIFRKRSCLSILCPWCNEENEYSFKEHHMECRKCSRRYRRIEEVNEIGFQEQDLHLAPSSSKKRKWEGKNHLFPMIFLEPSQQESHDDGDDIHLYIRVQMIDVRFRVVQQTLARKASSSLVTFGMQDLEDLEHLAENLAKMFSLSIEDCMDALQEGLDELWTLKVAPEKLHTSNTAGFELSGPLELLDYPMAGASIQSDPLLLWPCGSSPLESGQIEESDKPRPPISRQYASFIQPMHNLAGDGSCTLQSSQIHLNKQKPVDMGVALRYVNMVKERYANAPEIYKQFLEILQTYQRESTPMKDVYAQITFLFNSAPDLIEDFDQFMPSNLQQKAFPLPKTTSPTIDEIIADANAVLDPLHILIPT